MQGLYKDGCREVLAKIDKVWKHARRQTSQKIEGKRKKSYVYWVTNSAHVKKEKAFLGAMGCDNILQEVAVGATAERKRKIIQLNHATLSSFESRSSYD